MKLFYINVNYAIECDVNRIFALNTYIPGEKEIVEHIRPAKESVLDQCSEGDYIIVRGEKTGVVKIVFARKPGLTVATSPHLTSGLGSIKDIVVRGFYNV